MQYFRPTFLPARHEARGLFRETYGIQGTVRYVRTARANVPRSEVLVRETYLNETVPPHTALVDSLPSQHACSRSMYVWNDISWDALTYAVALPAVYRHFVEPGC
jgi:hypothetical protein